MRTIDFKTLSNGTVVITTNGVESTIYNPNDLIVRPLPNNESGAIVKLTDETWRRKYFLTDTITNNGVAASPFANVGALVDFLSGFFPEAGGVAGNPVNVKTMGATGNGTTDDTAAILSAMNYAKTNNIKQVYFPNGTYLISQTGTFKYIIPLVDGVDLIGEGKETTHILLSGGRNNPNPLFSTDNTSTTQSVNNILIKGIDFNGNLANQTYDPTYEFSIAVRVTNGSNIEVRDCKFQGWRGDGVLFGNTGEATLNENIVYNVSVHDNEFYNIYREGIMFCCVNGAKAFNNYFHGNGFYVAGIDIERHSVNEAVLNCEVYNNFFDFRDGISPVERGLPQTAYRRAISISFFHGGYAGGVADALSGGHKIHDNVIYQGEIDCWGHINTSIYRNTIINYAETIGTGFINGIAILVSDPYTTTGLTGVKVDNNNINSFVGTDGIKLVNYQNCTVTNNTLINIPAKGIETFSSGVFIDHNTIINGGSVSVSNSFTAILVNGSIAGVIVSNNQCTDTRGSNAAFAGVFIPSGATNISGTPAVFQHNRTINYSTPLNDSSTGLSNTKTDNIVGNVDLSVNIYPIRGQVALVAGTKAITIPGLTATSIAIVSLVNPSGGSLTIMYQGVCTSNTLTLRANIAAGTINTSDVSTVNYEVYQQ